MSFPPVGFTYSRVLTPSRCCLCVCTPRLLLLLLWLLRRRPTGCVQRRSHRRGQQAGDAAHQRLAARPPRTQTVTNTHLSFPRDVASCCYQLASARSVSMPAPSSLAPPPLLAHWSSHWLPVCHCHWLPDCRSLIGCLYCRSSQGHTLRTLSVTVAGL